jgi:hypothetical protein
VLAVAGLELFRTGNKKLAQNVAQQATAASGSPGAGKGEPATVSPSLVSLCIVLGQQQPAPGKEPDDANTFLVGQLGGLARQGPMDLGRVKAIEDPQVRLRALVAVARGTQESKGDATPVLQEAAALLEGELKGKPLAPWLLMQAVRIGVDAGLAGEKLAAFADSIAALPLKARAALEILRAKLDRLDGKADDAMLSAIDPTPRSLAGLLARQAIARHNASRDSDAYKAAEGSQDPEAAFAFLGVALGLQDKKK